MSYRHRNGCFAIIENAGTGSELPKVLGKLKIKKDSELRSPEHLWSARQRVRWAVELGALFYNQFLEKGCEGCESCESCSPYFL